MSDEKEKKDPTPASEKKEEKGKEETKPTPTKAAPAAGGVSAWLPVLVVIIITPILTMAVSEALIIPRVKKTFADVEAKIAETAHPAEGGPMAGEKKGGHGEKKTEKKAEKKGGHGGGGHGEKGGEDSGPSKEVKFENVVANLSGSMKTRFVKVSFTIEGEDDDFKDVIKENKTKLIDNALGILGAMTVAELDEPGIKNIMRSDLVNGFNQVLGKNVVKNLYFSEFVIQ